MKSVLSVFASLALLAAFSVSAFAAEDVLKGEVKTLEGKKVDLSQYKGKVLLIVNVASKCGKTPQYEPLQALYEQFGDQGFEVLGFPCNQFGKQEPGTASDIRQFCTDKYDVTFPLFEKIEVNGEETAPLYTKLKSFEADPGDVKWNFEKFLIGKNGEVIQRFRTKVEPDDKTVIEAIQAELKKDN
ncbi:glutathione peroxidase [Blastopirellula marina]|uniref:Glutathione peroxidase n=1 Tax=Blastopirellula marina TaxID=124 RepID=A0A2S8FGQ1_9BACT|nr:MULTISPECIES: glutathione peroxidase [Pirellulaceae]PQO31335.1 glutathione peroxidase [Blastopirellula marina]RCS51729.1 glutathione peroxidase [Bremerella cremea]